ncbi:unnamed protein product [Blepharisma stoltei]|uniref:Uncharacterized protein n=1 Tax=Blepharisma stoltei TaxID=1481888 RepID=A0AAU9IRV1_9CILI|nr:unnamed protein product [Blepharisma stoltei]
MISIDNNFKIWVHQADYHKVLGHEKRNWRLIFSSSELISCLANFKFSWMFQVICCSDPSNIKNKYLAWWNASKDKK